MHRSAAAWAACALLPTGATVKRNRALGAREVPPGQTGRAVCTGEKFLSDFPTRLHNWRPGGCGLDRWPSCAGSQHRAVLHGVHRFAMTHVILREKDHVRASSRTGVSEKRKRPTRVEHESGASSPGREEQTIVSLRISGSTYSCYRRANMTRVMYQGVFNFARSRLFSLAATVPAVRTPASGPCGRTATCVRCRRP